MFKNKFLKLFIKCVSEIQKCAQRSMKREKYSWNEWKFRRIFCIKETKEFFEREGNGDRIELLLTKRIFAMNQKHRILSIVYNSNILLLGKSLHIFNTIALYAFQHKKNVRIWWLLVVSFCFKSICSIWYTRNFITY